MSSPRISPKAKPNANEDNGCKMRMTIARILRLEAHLVSMILQTAGDIVGSMT